MVEETIKQTGERHGVLTRVAVQLGLGSETLRHWVKQAEVDYSQRPGSLHSFGYIATWAGGSDEADKTIGASAQRISRAARTILEQLEGSR